MNFDRCTNQWEEGETYLSSEGGYRLTTRVAGFGIQVCDILKHGTFQHRTTGHNAFSLAKAWCQDDYSGHNMAEEVRIPRTASER
jgi:hypothetical protein